MLRLAATSVSRERNSDIGLLMSFLPRGPGACFSMCWSAQSFPRGQPNHLNVLFVGNAEGLAFGMQLSTVETGETQNGQRNRGVQLRCVYACHILPTVTGTDILLVPYLVTRNCA